MKHFIVYINLVFSISILFSPCNPQDDFPVLKGEIIKVEQTATRFLNSAYLASPFGGAIPAKTENGTGRLVTVGSVYRLHFDFPENTDAPAMMYRGTARINVKPESIISRIQRRIIALIIRESGF